MSTLSIEDFMQYMLKHRAPNLAARAIADIFDRLVWCLDDNGEELLKVQEKWLLSDKFDEVEIALSMKEIFPFKNQIDRVRAFKQISERFPSLTPLCVEILREWELEHQTDNKE